MSKEKTKGLLAGERGCGSLNWDLVLDFETKNNRTMKEEMEECNRLVSKSSQRR